ncbi:hypothetical protein I656_00852 [Geobacillus sp. WSUCF1]|nr:hypothetical protein I656_00852 [Geobacillus sp. WSUCF1]
MSSWNVVIAFPPLYDSYSHHYHNKCISRNQIFFIKDY